MESRMHPFRPMTLKIARESDDQRTTLRLSGRIQSANVDEIREQMEGNGETIVLDLEEVTLVDVDVVRFLSRCEAEGVELANCSPYIRDWIFWERSNDEKD
jgi:anti-anti-sigma regulatory factor